MRENKGFTLIELLAVILVVAILGILVIPVVFNKIEEARIKAFKIYGDKALLKAEENYVKDSTTGKINGAITKYNVKKDLGFQDNDSYDGYIVVNNCSGEKISTIYLWNNKYELFGVTSTKNVNLEEYDEQDVNKMKNEIKNNIVDCSSFKTFDIKLIYDNGEPDKTIKVQNHHSIEGLDAPIKEGFTFTGWHKNDGTLVKNGDIFADGMNIDLTAGWELEGSVNNPGVFNITYKNNCGLVINPTTYKSTDKIILKNPIKTGYTFDGWYLDGQKITMIKAGTTGDLTIEARCSNSIRKLLIKKGTGVSSIDLVVDGNLTNITSAAYSTDVYGGTKYGIITHCLDSYGTLTPNEAYTMGDTDSEHTITCEKDIYTCTPGNYLPKRATKCSICKNGYACSGGTFKKKDEDQGIIKCSSGFLDITGTNNGEGQIHCKELTLTYSNNGGTGCTNKKIYKNEPFGELCEPKKEGYIFDGWYKKTLLGKKEKVTENSTSTSNLTVSADWKKILTITYDNQGGIGCTTQQTSEGTKFGTLCTPVRDGYKFNGWYKDGVKVSITSTTTSNITLYAKWTKTRFTIKYNNNGGTGCETQIYNLGDTNTSLCTPERTGYKFEGWYKDLSKADDNSRYTPISSLTEMEIKEDVSLFAGWSYNIVLTYNNQGGTGCTNKTFRKYGTTPVMAGVLCTPAKPGYIFNGWYTAIILGNRMTDINFITNDSKIYKDTIVYADWVPSYEATKTESSYKASVKEEWCWIDYTEQAGKGACEYAQSYTDKHVDWHTEYSCPKGGKLSGTTCKVTTYTCPKGGRLEETTCYAE